VNAKLSLECVVSCQCANYARISAVTSSEQEHDTGATVTVTAIGREAEGIGPKHSQVYSHVFGGKTHMGAIDKRATAVIGDVVVAPSTDAMWRWCRCRAVALLINWQHNKVLFF